MPLAHAEVPIPRQQLDNPAHRLRIRMRLYEMLLKLGDVRHIRYVRDPLDGPLAEQGLPTNETAVVRAVAIVEPRR